MGQESESIYVRLKRAAINGTGIRISASDAHDLYFRDTGINVAADAEDGFEGLPGTHGTYAQQKRRAEEE